MKPVRYDGGALVCEEVGLADIAAKTGTPCYVYSAATVLENYRSYDESPGEGPHTVCYAEIWGQEIRGQATLSLNSPANVIREMELGHYPFLNSPSSNSLDKIVLTNKSRRYRIQAVQYF